MEDESVGFVNRFVGAKSPEALREAQGMVQNIFDSQYDSSELWQSEREKTPEQIEIIRFVDKITNEFLASCGLSAKSVPVENIHLIDPADFKNRNNNNVGVYSPELQAITFSADVAEINIVFVRNLIHEMLHAKAFSSVDIVSDDGSDVSDRRVGFAVMPRSDRKDIPGDVAEDGFLFHRLNEAITELVTELIMRENAEEFESSPLFADDIKQTRGLRLEALGILDDVYYIGKTEEDELFGFGFGYERERELLVELVQKLYSRNQTTFSDPVEVFDLFKAGAIGGNILPVARLIEKTFGPGSFKELGIVTASRHDDPEQADPFVEFIEKL